MVTNGGSMGPRYNGENYWQLLVLKISEEFLLDS